MKNLLYLLVLSLSFGFIKNAASQERSLLWEISGNGLKSSSYLFGTMHQICSDDYFWTDTMDKYLHRAEQVCFEIKMDDPLLILKAAYSIKAKPGHTIRDLFSGNDYKRLSVYFKKATGISLSKFEEVRPAFVLLFIQSNSTTCSDPTGYEREITNEIRKFETPILGLESISQQIDYLSASPDVELVGQIMRIVDGKYIRSQKHLTETARLLSLYQRQDIASLKALIMESGLKGLGSAEILVDERNKKWIPEIAKIAAQKSTFFAVGAAHLGGEKGVIELLIKEGFTLTPLFSEEESNR